MTHSLVAQVGSSRRGFLGPRHALALATCLALAACARLPETKPLKPSAGPHRTPSIHTAKGAMSETNAASVLARRLGASGAHATVMAGLEEAATGRPLIAGNKVTLLFDGPRTIAAMMTAVAAARHAVHLETYLFDQDDLGLKFADLLIAKRREGVQVRIIYDCVGTLGTPQAFFARMEEAGIELLPFHPVSPLHQIGRWRLNNRDHRKILVVDGAIAFTGGVNITTAYSRGSLFRSRARELGSLGWRDTHIQIEGPAVAALQWMFLESWASQTEGEGPVHEPFPPLPTAGEHLLRVLGSNPGDNPEIYRAYLLAIQGARKSILLTTAYFVPDPQILKALLAAARRGVNVMLLLPSVSDSGPVFYAGHSFYVRLLKAGVRVFELNTAMQHAKTAVIDGNWSTVGSANMDMRSFLHNKEVNVIVLGDDFGREMDRAFQDDLKDATEIFLEPWKRRPLAQRCKEWLAGLVSYWL